jgi:hypothetical protein
MGRPCHPRSCFSPKARAPAFIHIGYSERYSLDGATWGRFWLINVFRDPSEYGPGDAIGSWTLYGSACGGADTLPVISYWIDGAGRIVRTIPETGQMYSAKTPEHRLA